VCVTRTGDTFLAFLEWLEANLDDPGTDIPGAASELAVSRPVLDRLVVAMAGEPPATLRRRVLLERAAFQLRSTKTPVLEVAIAAGYQSQEAFTRAFAREFGGPPRRWRNAEAPLGFAGRSGVHFYPPEGIRFLDQGAMSAMNFTTAFFDHHVRYLGQLLEQVAALPEGDLDEPIRLSVPSIDDQPTIRSLMSRLIGQMEMWSASMSGGVYDFAVERDESVGSMRTRLTRVGPAFTMAVRDLGERDGYDETFVDTTCETPFSFTAAGMLGHILTYGSYRRTLVTAAVEAASGASMVDDPLEWFAP
jgi:AraC family transcriptional regulator